VKVLEATPYIYVSGHKHASRNKSGLAYMVRDIVDMLNVNGADIYVLTQSIFTKEKKVNKWRLVHKGIYDLLFNVKLLYIKKALEIIKYNKYPLKFNLRILLYFLTGGYMEKVIEKIKPDIVHIHGIGLYTLPFIYACAVKNIPFIVTLHGLISFDDSVGATSFDCIIEKEFLKLSVIKNLPITVISSGIKEKIKSFLQQECSNIKVILNSINDTNIDITNNIIQNKKCKSVLSVGSVCDRKNQIQVIRAFNELNRMNYNDLTLTIIGDGEIIPLLKEYCNKNRIHNVFFTGAIPRDEVDKYYNNSDLLVLASKDEGFGLPVIEAYKYGVPVVAFSDLDAIPDLYNPNCMILVDERTDEALAYGIKEALEKKWDKEYINKYVSKFDSKIIRKQYYNALLEVNKTSINVKDVDLLLFESLKKIL